MPGTHIQVAFKSWQQTLFPDTFILSTLSYSTLDINSHEDCLNLVTTLWFSGQFEALCSLQSLKLRNTFKAFER